MKMENNPYRSKPDSVDFTADLLGVTLDLMNTNAFTKTKPDWDTIFKGKRINI
jgi:hypothetical protein